MKRASVLCKMHQCERYLRELQLPTRLKKFLFQLGIPSGAFDVLMLRMARDGRLASLEELRCFQWEVCLETMLFIIDNCPRLNHIWGLDLLMLSPQSIAAIQVSIVSYFKIQFWH